MSAQIRAKRFQPFLYWVAITATTFAGTTLADLVDHSLGIGYLGGSLSLFMMVMATLGLWYWSLGSVSVETVTSPKVEALYWATIMYGALLDVIDRNSRRLFAGNGQWLAALPGDLVQGEADRRSLRWGE